ncbi:hypothetical protein [Planctomonas deserti]|uniref:hypothetical protein n=1 Tax=Planctomonas deserti TaxID=2144185 RepID=UPI00197C99B9|nr:hypothetical protein [Planctomonas deserti]
MVDAGRDPDDVKLVMFVTFSLGTTVCEALDRRRALDARVDEAPRMAELAALLGMPLHPDRLEDPVDASTLGVDSSTRDPRALEATRLARDGWSPRDLLAHGVLDHTPGLAGTATDAADFLEQYLDAGAADGFILSLDDHTDGIAAFTETVIPLLRARGRLRDSDATLRERLGVPPQYGLRSTSRP